MITATRRFEFDAAHRVMRHESKCATLHGHRYVAEVEVEAAELDSCARVIDFGQIKAVVGAWIDDHWDHTTLLNAEDVKLLALLDAEARGDMTKRRPFIFLAEPTAETIAAVLLAQAQQLLNGNGLRVVRVRVYETPNCFAEVHSDR